jgi:hypothetical protein
MFNRKTYKQFVIESVELLCPFKKKSIYSHSYYYDMIFLMLNNINTWKGLSITTKYGDKSKYHYTTIRKIHSKWSKLNIFLIAYNNMIAVYKLNCKCINDDLFIDAAFTSNKTGSELVDTNPMYYKKKVTKLSIICDSNRIPIIVIPVKTKTYDGNTIIPSVEPLTLKRKTNLIADKGYIKNRTFKKYLLKKYKINIITPRKKNQKNMRISKYMKLKLKVRNKVENCIQQIKSFNRIFLRKDNKLINYMNFVYFGCGIKLEKYIKIN